MNGINKDLALWEWASRWEPLHDQLVYGFQGDKAGDCSIFPVSDKIVKQYITGTRIIDQTICIQRMAIQNETPDTHNAENYLYMRQWLNWIERQTTYPEYGATDYQIILNGSPDIAMQAGDGKAKYVAYFRLRYTEKA
jgi:hypothetical protein